MIRETVAAISEVGENIADGINNVYSNYSDAKSKFIFLNNEHR
jgi:hypothetical protein